MKSINPEFFIEINDFKFLIFITAYNKSNHPYIAIWEIVNI